MGKTDHKAKKRKRSTSSNQFASLEAKMSPLIDMLTYKEVRTISRPSHFLSRASSTADRGSRSESGSTYSTRPDSNKVNSASLVEQAVPTNLQGVYDIAGSVFAKYRRHDDTTICWICI